MTRKEMWNLAQGIDTKLLTEHRWGLSLLGIKNEADVKRLLAMGWTGTAFAMDYEDGQNVKAADRIVPPTDDFPGLEEMRQLQSAYDRLDARLGGN